MYYQNYEDYMRNVLGYSNTPMNSTYPTDEFYYTSTRKNTEELGEMEELYPDIYKIVYPMVCKICDRNGNRTIDRQVLDEMTEEIYNNIEPEMEMDVRTNNKQELRNGDVKNPNAKEENQKKETRQRNYMLQDLIRILLLRELLRRRRVPNRPPMPPFPGGRPPFPGGPGPMRPPMSRNYNDFYVD